MKSEQAAFGERLRLALKQAGIEASPVELVRLLARNGGGSVTQQAVSGWINGKSLPRQANMRALAKLLKTDVLALQYGEGGRRVREETKPWKIPAVDQMTIDAYLALPTGQRKLVRELVATLAKAAEAD